MLDSNLASNTVNGRIKSCKAFFRYLYEEGIISQNIAGQFQLIIAEKKMIQTLTKEQMIQLLNQPNALIDYYGRPKLGWSFVANAFVPQFSACVTGIACAAA